MYLSLGYKKLQFYQISDEIIQIRLTNICTHFEDDDELELVYECNDCMDGLDVIDAVDIEFIDIGRLFISSALQQKKESN